MYKKKYMEHYYVITGNEFGADVRSKENFSKNDMEKAFDKFENLKNKEEYFYVGLYYVNNEGKETIIEEFIDEC